MLKYASQVKEKIERMIGWIRKQKLNDQQIDEVIEAILHTQDEIDSVDARLADITFIIPDRKKERKVLP